MGDLFNKNFVIAAVIAFLIIVFWDNLFLKDIREQEAASSAATTATAVSSGASKQSIVANTATTQPQNLPRISISNSSVVGSLSMQAGRIDDISLLHFQETVDKNSPNIHLFNKKGTQNAYFFESGWLSENNITLPTADTIWSLEAGSSNKLTPETPVSLVWKNPQGITFRKHISIDDLYMITVKDEIVNNTKNELTINPFALIVRHGDPQTRDLFISHEGFVGHVGGSLERVKYKDTLSETFKFDTQGGWIGFTDQYWLSALVLDNSKNYTTRFLSYKDSQNINNFQLDSLGKDTKLLGGESFSKITRVFVGPKEYNILSKYDDMYNIGKFTDAIDFGWFFFITKPMMMFLLFLYGFIGNFGYTILVFTIIIRAIILPIAYKSYVSMAKMKELQPKMKELKTLHKGDMQKYNKEVANLYKKEKVNPLSGCLPLFLQIPIFFSIYKVIFISIEMRHAPFIGWIRDMSAMDPSNIFTLFGLIPINMPDFLHIGILPILMGVTMFFQQKLSMSQTLEPMQQRIMNLMPVVLVIVLASFPAGLVIYWIWSNIISIIQQLIINKTVHKEFGLRRKKNKVKA
ncbi:MAG: membrane protein insertase YidC [Alphaproteobacteria bacterium]|jgi:YidC/Oxa1 family membrane protein insertase|nr:membrane protein insertase YidC [Alphaproteobacteria bacterium]